MKSTMTTLKHRTAYTSSHQYAHTRFERKWIDIKSPNAMHGLHKRNRDKGTVNQCCDRMHVTMQANKQCTVDDKYYPKKDVETRMKIQFSCISYNVLCAEYIEKHHFHVPKWMIDTPFRKKNLIKEVKSIDADIVALQEVDDFEMWNKHLQKHHNGVYKKRTEVQKKRTDGCAIFYRKDKFVLRAQRAIEYCRIPVADARDNIGMMAMLELRTQHNENVDSSSSIDKDGCTGCFVCVVNTHILYNPNRGDLKLAQFQQLLASIDLFVTDFMKQQGGTIAIILAGDFNALPCSALMDFLLNGKLQLHSLDRKKLDGQNWHQHSKHCKRELYGDKYESFDQLPSMKENDIRTKMQLLHRFHPRDTLECVYHNLLLHPVYGDSTLHYRDDICYATDGQCVTDVYGSPLRYRPTAFHKRFKGQVDQILYTPFVVNATPLSDQMSDVSLQHVDCTNGAEHTVPLPLHLRKSSLISPGDRVLVLRKLLEMPNLHILADPRQSLITRYHSSDHFPLAAQFEFLTGI